MAWKEAANQEDIPVSSSEPQKNSRPSYQFTKSQRFYLPVKRFFDIFFSLLFLLILSPVL